MAAFKADIFEKIAAKLQDMGLSDKPFVIGEDGSVSREFAAFDPLNGKGDNDSLERSQDNQEQVDVIEATGAALSDPSGINIIGYIYSADEVYSQQTWDMNYVENGEDIKWNSAQDCNLTFRGKALQQFMPLFFGGEQ
jgi:hypothetical protein